MNVNHLPDRVLLSLREATPAWDASGAHGAGLGGDARPGASDGQRRGHHGDVVCGVRCHVDRDDGGDDVSVHGTGRDSLDVSSCVEAPSFQV